MSEDLEEKISLKSQSLPAHFRYTVQEASEETSPVDYPPKTLQLGKSACLPEGMESILPVEDEKKKETSSLPMASVNYMNSIIGSGVIGMPYALSLSGIGLGVFLMILVAVLTDYSLMLIIRAGIVSGSDSYQATMEAAFGKVGFYILTLMQFLYPFIAMISYNVIVGDTITKVLIRLAHISTDNVFAQRELIIVVTAVLVTLPISLYRNMARLAKISLFSLLLVTFIMVTLLIRLVSLGPQIPSTKGAWDFADRNFMQAIGIYSYAFMCHHNAFLLFGSLRCQTQSAWNRITHVSVWLSVFVGVIFALTGYITFTGYTQGDVLENYCWQDDLMNVSRLFFAVNILLTFPIECFVARDVLELLLFSKYQQSPLWRHFIVTSLLVFSTAFVSLTTDCLGIVLEINGLIAAVPLAYLLPALCYCKLEDGPFICWRKVPAIFLIFFGILVTVVGFVMIILQKDDIHSCSHGTQFFYCYDLTDSQNDQLPMTYKTLMEGFRH